MTKHAQFRFYEELNDFLPTEKRKIDFTYEFDGTPSIKDVVEALGVPHTEIDLILVNGASVDFSYHMCDVDIISVYPVFESLDISPVTHLREKPLREPKFILDVHLGKLAKYMRLLGFDTVYDNLYDDHEIVALAVAQKRTILTRDV
ncbi:MAG: twitching motility protein PilT, partial [Candidatus Latescibacteria bacterium]|nr:twitching motility protein PilT [Candidatus Latescibacterota bacterium]